MTTSMELTELLKLLNKEITLYKDNNVAITGLKIRDSSFMEPFLSHIHTLEEQNKRMREALEEIAHGMSGMHPDGAATHAEDVAMKALSLLP